MLLSEYKRSTTVPAEAIYQAWAEPATWSKWDSSVQDVQLEGPVEVGATGKLTPVKGPSATMRIVKIVENEAFDNASKLPGAQINFNHEIWEIGDSREVLVRVFISGPLTFLWSRILRKDLAYAAHGSVNGLLDMLEK